MSLSGSMRVRSLGGQRAFSVQVPEFGKLVSLEATKASRVGGGAVFPLRFASGVARVYLGIPLFVSMSCFLSHSFQASYNFQVFLFLKEKQFLKHWMILSLVQDERCPQRCCSLTNPQGSRFTGPGFVFKSKSRLEASKPGQGFGASCLCGGRGPFEWRGVGVRMEGT